ncbi:hypothetical protein ACXU4B_03875 [Dyella soli]|uniref:Uncharacterized protein n=1 Tax=Dyella soli TaxID=522319 RepID=A0A4R0YUI4_9GAMM|nr:hypothetical protein [Dyella soli]TCI10172.1 hypothetical protein EZM97_14760 [Dyella soli]
MNIIDSITVACGSAETTGRIHTWPGIFVQFIREATPYGSGPWLPRRDVRRLASDEQLKRGSLIPASPFGDFSDSSVAADARFAWSLGEVAT